MGKDKTALPLISQDHTKYLQNHLIARNIYSTLAELAWNFQSYFSIYLREKIKA